MIDRTVFPIRRRKCYALIAGNGDSIFKRLAVIDRPTQGG